MTLHPHLPPAVDFIDADSLRDVRDDELAEMLEECRRWCQHLERFRASLVTPVALTLWKVLLHTEVLLVAAASLRIETEIAARLRDAAEDAVPAPGEDSRHLDGQGATEGEVTTQI
ncbi:hypothetical protein [Aureimonas glaciei]|uniref:Uncharacterized protein n=1 Tax=Aureimonas glaciei TaxID=1776957 RepID=A0A916Y333_9HYPH|nr:hypothetical protein [Aureimonas glaciei]GGD28795.1 hypothetical protein GCM10011335_34950 [Aureimonas glaciei]